LSAIIAGSFARLTKEKDWFGVLPGHLKQYSMPDFFDTITLQKAQRMITGCEACSDDAEIPLRQRSRSADGIQKETWIFSCQR
jgi:hypothetical protein